MTYIGAVFLVQLTRNTSQTSKWGQTRLGCVDASIPLFFHFTIIIIGSRFIGSRLRTQYVESIVDAGLKNGSLSNSLEWL